MSIKPNSSKIRGLYIKKWFQSQQIYNYFLRMKWRLHSHYLDNRINKKWDYWFVDIGSVQGPVTMSLCEETISHFTFFHVAFIVVTISCNWCKILFFAQPLSFFFCRLFLCFCCRFRPFVFLTHLSEKAFSIWVCEKRDQFKFKITRDPCKRR